MISIFDVLRYSSEFPSYLKNEPRPRFAKEENRGGTIHD
jgi:hypothetical protein